MNRVVPEKKIGNGKRAEAEVAPDDAAAVRSSQPRIQSQLRLYRYRGYNRNCGYTATSAIIATSVIQPLCQYGHGSRWAAVSYASPLEKSNQTRRSGAGSRSMLDKSSLLNRRSRIRRALGPFHCRKSNIRSENGRKAPVPCTKSNIAARAVAM